MLLEILSRKLSKGNAYVPQVPDCCRCARDFARDCFCGSHDNGHYNCQAGYHPVGQGREGEGREDSSRCQESEGNCSPAPEGQAEGQQGLSRITPPVNAGGVLLSKTRLAGGLPVSRHNWSPTRHRPLLLKRFVRKGRKSWLAVSQDRRAETASSDSALLDCSRVCGVRLI
jgi:hypothetical protein